MRIVVALGGNALLKRGEPMTHDVQRANIQVAARALAPVAQQHQIVLAHGNGPQVGLLALQSSAYKEVEAYPLDVLGAQTEGMIGYMIEQELGNLLPFEVPFATILTMVEVDPQDPAFQNPTKFVGPVYEKEEADRLKGEKGWAFKQDGNKWRRVVPSPLPKRILEIRQVKWLLEKGTLVICADINGVYLDWGKPEQRLIGTVTAEELRSYNFPAGSMGPKVAAAIQFVEMTGKRAAIGSLADIGSIVAGKAGTNVVATKD